MTGNDIEPGRSRVIVLAAMGVNLDVAVAKFIGFLLTGSGPLLAETFHSIADTGNQGLLLLGSHRSAASPTPGHPFGRGPGLWNRRASLPATSSWPSPHLRTHGVTAP